MNHKHENVENPASGMTRRAVMSGAATAMLLAACACNGSLNDPAEVHAAAETGAPCNFDGFGAPYPDAPAMVDPRTTRALLALLLLFVTRKDFVFDKTDFKGTITKAKETTLAGQVGVLTHLKAKDEMGNPISASEVLHALVNTINTVNPMITVPATPSGVAGKFNVTYGAALLIVQELCGKLLTGNTEPSIRGTYTGPPENCPKSVNAVLSIATNAVNPVS